MTYRAAKFIEANRQSPVVYGSVTGPEGAPTGCYYRLADNRAFELTSAELRLLPEPPRWALDEIAA
jgi:hypothetical protein